MLKFSLDLLKAGLSGDFNALKDLTKKLESLEGFIAKMCSKYGPSTTILPHPYIDNYTDFSVIEASIGLLRLRGGVMCVPLLNIDDEDRKRWERA